MSSSAPSHSSAMSGLPSQHGRRPEILLDKNCRIGSCQNTTSAIAENSEGLSVEVSFEIRDPPALSLCFARCHDLAGIQRLPRGSNILSVAGALVLLAIPFSDDGSVNQRYMDYFVYRAGPGTPSLRLLPGPYPSCRLSNIAVVPIRGDSSEHYAVAFPDLNYGKLVTKDYADLHIYRSDTKAWCTKQVALLAEDMEIRNAMTMKLLRFFAMSVVYAGSGLVGWVDLSLGILLCNVLDENPTVRFVALPGPCETHTEFYGEFENDNPVTYRHVTMHDGVMKFIELKYHQEAAFNPKRRDDQGWMATTWTRPVSSDVWHEGLTFDTSDISVTGDDSSFLHLLPEILVEEAAWEKFNSGAPILSLHDDNIVYILVVKRNLVDTVTIVLTLNTGSLTLESCAQCFGDMMMAYFEPSYVPSVLSSYFGVTTSVLSYRDVKHASNRSANTHPVLSPSAAPSKHREKAPVKVFGPAMSPTVARVLVCLEEVGTEYEVVNIDYATREHESPEHLARNPFGQIPAFQDGDLLLWESRAISKYVLRKYGTDQVDLLRAGNLEEAALVDVWTEVDAHTYNPALSPVVYECLLNPLLHGTPTNHKVVAESLEKLKKVLEVYEVRLSKHRYLAGDFVSFADINHFPYTFYFMSTPHVALFDSYPHVKAWWDRLMARPAVKKIAATMIPPKR